MFALDVFKPHLPAEAKLLECAQKGEQCILGRKRPVRPQPDTTIRAGFLRALLLENCCHHRGVRLNGAYIDGTLNLDGVLKIARFHLSQCKLNGNLSFCDAETSTIKIEGSIIRAILGYGAKVDGELLLWESTIENGVHLFGAEITCTFSCSGATIGKRRDHRYKEEFSLNLDTATIRGNLDLSDIRAKAVVLLDDAQIRGKLDCRRGRFQAVRSSVEDQSQLEKTPKPWKIPVRAIRAYRLKLAGSLYLRGARSAGEITFTGARIDGDVDCSEGFFWAGSKIDPVALRFSRSKIGGNTYLRNVCVRGKVEFVGASVQGVINCAGGTFSVPSHVEASDLSAPEERLALDAISLANAEIKGDLLFARDKDFEDATVNGSLDLKGAFVRVLVDSEASWPKQPPKCFWRFWNKRPALRNAIHLDGFTFERFGGKAPRDAETRMRWLRLQPKSHMATDFRPQPFEQLIKVLKDMGHPEDIRKLAIEREKRLYKSRRKRWWTLPGLFAVFSTVTVGWLMGYGYRPFRAFALMLVVGVLCGLFYDHVKEQAVFAPRDSQILLAEDLKKCMHPPQSEQKPQSGAEQKPQTWSMCLEKHLSEYPQFNPYIYSLNVLFPIVDLFQEKSWVPVRKKVELKLPYARTVTAPECTVQAVLYTELAFGSLVNILAVALFSGLIRRVHTD